jgi:hypothetical protein
MLGITFRKLEEGAAITVKNYVGSLSNCQGPIII